MAIDPFAHGGGHAHRGPVPYVADREDAGLARLERVGLASRAQARCRRRGGDVGAGEDVAAGVERKDVAAATR